MPSYVYQAGVSSSTRGASYDCEEMTTITVLRDHLMTRTSPFCLFGVVDFRVSLAKLGQLQARALEQLRSADIGLTFDHARGKEKKFQETKKLGAKSRALRVQHEANFSGDPDGHVSESRSLQAACCQQMTYSENGHIGHAPGKMQE